MAPSSANRDGYHAQLAPQDNEAPSWAEVAVQPAEVTEEQLQKLDNERNGKSSKSPVNAETGKQQSDQSSSKESNRIPEPVEHPEVPSAPASATYAQAVKQRKPKTQAKKQNGSASASKSKHRSNGESDKSWSSGTTARERDNSEEEEEEEGEEEGELEQEKITQHTRQSAGPRLAPLRVPLPRRLQTFAVLVHCSLLAFCIPLFLLACSNVFLWPLLVPYLLHILFSTAASDGSLTYRSKWFRSMPLWKWFAAYFPAELHKTHELPATRKYIFGYHPHGIISHGAWVAFATEALGFSKKFPGITNSLLTLDSNFNIPFYREYVLASGVRSVSKESIKNILRKGGLNGEGMGRAVTIVIGGARESLEACPGTMRLILHNRLGFVKLAVQTGADLVPVIGFGESDLYDQLNKVEHPWVHKFQMFTLRVMKFTVPFMHGRGIFNYDYGLMPYRRPMNIVVGKPIKVEASSSSAQIDMDEVKRVHELYCEELKRLYDEYKDVYFKHRTQDLELLE